MSHNAKQLFALAKTQAPCGLKMDLITYNDHLAVRLYKNNFTMRPKYEIMILHDFVSELMRNMKAISPCVLEVKNDVNSR